MHISKLPTHMTIASVAIMYVFHLFYQRLASQFLIFSCHIVRSVFEEAPSGAGQVSLRGEARKKIAIPEEASFYSFSYPIIVSDPTEDTSDRTPT